MFWVVLIADLTGLQLHSATAGRSLFLAASLFTVPLALGLYYAVRPVGILMAGCALGFRLLEAVLGIVSTAAGFVGIQALLAGSSVGTQLLHLLHWTHARNFVAFVFTIGSTLFFYLFARSRYIPRVLSWWGLFASVTALAACLTHLVRPAFPAMMMYAWIPLLIAETSTGLWLLIKSVRVAD
jgi:hypothetical protein